jgi:hypothetical protein
MYTGLNRSQQKYFLERSSFLEHKRYWFGKNEHTSGQTDCVLAADDGVEDAIVKVGCRVEKVARGAWSFGEFCYENKKMVRLFQTLPTDRLGFEPLIFSNSSSRSQPPHKFLDR